MIGGGNITDISQLNGIKLITSYWSGVNDFINSKYSFVGDVHGDLHQFLAPLVMNRVIKLTGKVKIINEEIKYYVPEYELIENGEMNESNSSSSSIIYLGDIADEWIFSRTISKMLYELLKSKKVIYIYGNHDLSIIGRYHLFKARKLNIPEDLPPLWETLKKELNCIKEVKIYRNKVLFNNDEEKGLEFLYKYVEPLFENLFKIFNERLGVLSLASSINGENYIISHCSWTKKSVRQLIEDEDVNEVNRKRPSDNDESQLMKVIDNYNPSNESIEYIKNINFNNVDYKKLSESCNDLFNSKSRLFISKNGITYTRNTEGIFVNQITGHTIGSEWREIGVNVNQSTFNKERIDKLKPTIINGKKIYYFDFGASAGYEHDEISRPDFVYSTSSGMFVSNLPAFSFICMSKGGNDDEVKDSLLIMKDKTPRSPNKIILN